MFLSLALRSYHETVEEILELTKKVQPAGGRQYQSVATCSEVDVNGHVIIIYYKTFSLKYVEQLKIYAQVEKLHSVSLKPTALSTILARKSDHRSHEGLHLVGPGNRNYLI
jgi:hypothetical protein